MTATLVHSQHNGYGSASAIVPTVTPTPGNMLVMNCYIRAIGQGPSAITGWTQIESVLITADSGGNYSEISMFYRVAQVGDSTWGPAGNAWNGTYSEWAGVAGFLDSVASPAPYSDGHIICGGAITVAEPALIVGGNVMTGINDTAACITLQASPNILLSESGGVTGNPYWFTAYQNAAGAGTYTVDGNLQTGTAGIAWMRGITAAFSLGDAEPPDDEPPPGLELDVFYINPPGTSYDAVGTLDEATQKSIRPVRNEAGSGLFTLNRHSAEATAAVLTPGNFVKVRIPIIDPDNYIFGYFLDSGDFTLLDTDEEGGEDVTFGGDGLLAYLGRAVWRNYKYSVEWWPADMADPPAGAEGLLRVQDGRYRFYHMAGSPLEVVPGDPSDSYAFNTVTEFDSYFEEFRAYDWDFSNGKGTGQLFLVKFMAGQPHAAAWMSPTQNTIPAQMILPGWAQGDAPINLSDVGITPGAVLYRMIREAQDADRPAQPIPLVTIDFTETLDSNGDNWSDTEALFGITVDQGENYLDTLNKLLATGVIDVVMGPDFDLHAYNSYGRDLTGSSFGPGVVRFAKGVNISEQLRREILASAVATHAEVLTNAFGGYQRAEAELPDAATRVTREISVVSETQVESEMEAFGEAALDATRGTSDALTFEHVTDDDEDVGLYLPGPDYSDHGKYWIGDTVTIHTGTSDEDYDEVELRVQAITITEDEAGNLRALPEVMGAVGEAERRLYRGGRGVNETPFSTLFRPQPTPESGGSRGAGTSSDVADFVAALALDDLSDVTAPAPADGEALVWDDGLSAWVPGTAGGSSALTVEELDGVPTDSAVTKIVFPNGTLSIVGHVATFTPSAAVGGGGGGGGVVLLEQHTASSSAALDFTTFISSTYDEYEFEFVGVMPATSGDAFWMRMGTGGGPTYDTGTNYSYDGFVFRGGGSAVSGGLNQTHIALAYEVADGIYNGVAALPFFGSVKLAVPQDTSLYKPIWGMTHYVDSAGGFRLGWQITGQYDSATAVTAIRFLMSSGNIASGTIRVYGIAKSLSGGDVTIPLLDGGRALYQPTVVGGGAVTVPLLDASHALYAPTVGTGFYVATTGNDTTGDGSIGNPWLTIQKFVDTNPVPGSTLYLRGGNYAESSGFTCGRDTYGSLVGTSTAPITIRNYPTETVSFPGVTDHVFNIGPNETSNTIGANYLVIDGIRFPSATINDTATVALGGFEPTLYLVQNVTIRNCYFSLTASSLSIDHCIGIIRGVNGTIIEDCIFESGGLAGQGDAIVTYDTPAATGTIIRRCIFKTFDRAAIQVWDEAGGSPVATFTIQHCSFIACNHGIDPRRYLTAHIYDCAFNTASGITSIDTTNTIAGTPTLDHNFYSQTFDSGNLLVAGQSGRGAASDGLDAGALDW